MVVAVDAGPPNDDFDNASSLGSLANTSDSGTTVGANLQGGEPDPIGTGGRSVWWTWTAPATGWVQADTLGSSIDTLLYVFTGTAEDSLTTIAVNDNGAGTRQSLLNFYATLGVTYRIAIHGRLEDEGAVTINVSTPGTGPPSNDNFISRINLGSASTVNRTGDTNDGATLSYTTSAEPDPLGVGGTSVWYSWTAPSTGQFQIDTFGSDFDTVLYVYTGPIFALLNAAGVDDNSGGELHSRVLLNATSGVNYKIAVHGYRGETGIIDLNIGPSSASPPANNHFADRIVLASNPTVTGTGNNGEGGVEPMELDPLEFGGASTWWSWTAPSNGWVEINTFGSIDPGTSNALDTILYVFTGSSLGNLVTVASDNDSEGDLHSRVNFQVNDGQTYQIAVHGFLGDTGDITINILPGTQPPNYDEFSGKKDIGKLGTSTQLFTNVGCSIESSEPTLLDNSPTFAPDGGPGGASAWFKMTADRTGVYEINTFGSDFDTVLYVFNEADSIAELIEVGANDDAGGGIQSQVTFSATKDEKYRIAVYGFLGATGNITLTVADGAPAPLNDNFANRIDLLNAATVTTSGNNDGATLEAGEPDPTGVGGTSVWWTWTAPSTGWFAADTFGSLPNTIVNVFTGSTLGTLSNVAFNDNTGLTLQSKANFFATAGQVYQISVHGFLADSGALVLNLGPGNPPPANDDFADRIDLGSGSSVSASGSNVDASVESGEPDPYGEGDASVWWSWTAPATGWMEARTFGSDFDTLLYIFTGSTLPTLAVVASNDESPGTEQSRVLFFATAGVTYHFGINGDLGDEGAISFALDPGVAPPPNDQFLDRIFLGNAFPVMTTGNNVGANIDNDEPDSLETGGRSVWWAWEAPVSGLVTIDTFGSDFDTVLYAFTGSTLENLVEVDASEDAQDGVQSRLNFAAIGGQTYLIAVHGDNGASGDIALNISTGFAPPGNDLYDDKIDLGKSKTFESISTTGVNAGAAFEEFEQDSLGYGNASVWFKWEAEEEGYYQIDTFGSDFNTILYLFDDKGNIEDITELAFNDDAEGVKQSRLNFYSPKDKKYRIAVLGANQSWGNYTLNINGGPVVPANDDFASATNLGTVLSATVSGSNAGASVERFEPNPSEESGASVWWSWTAPASGYYQADTFGSAARTILSVFQGASLDALVEVGSNEDDHGGTDDSRVVFFASAGQSYKISVAGEEGTTGAVNLNLSGSIAPPANDRFVDAIHLGGAATVATSGANLAATLELFEPDSLDEGGYSVWWSWTAPSSGWVEADTLGSDFDTVLYVFTGAALEDLSQIGFNDSGAGSDQSVVNFAVTAGTTYHFAVHGDEGVSGSIEFKIGPGVTPPGNDNFSGIIDLGSGGTASTSTTNAGASLQNFEPDPLNDGGTSVWWKWTAPSNAWFNISTFGSNFDTLLYVFEDLTPGDAPVFDDLSPVAANDAAGGSNQSQVNLLATAGTTYYIAVNGDDGEIGTVNLGIGSGTPPPANDDLANATPLATAATVNTAGSNVGASREFEVPEPSLIGTTDASVWWSWTPPSSGWVEINTFGSSFDTVLAVYSGTSYLDLTPVAVNDAAAGGSTSRVNFAATAGTPYLISVLGDRGATGSFLLSILPGVPAPANDNFVDGIDLGSASPVSDTGSNVGASLEVIPGVEPLPLGEGGASVWWRWTAPSNGFFQINTFGSSIDTVLYLFEGDSMGELEVIAGNDEAAGTSTSRINFEATAGVTYHIAVHGDNGITGNISIAVDVGVPPPANDNFADAIDLGNGTIATATGSNEGAGNELGEPDPISGSSASVWWKWTAPASGNLAINTFGSNFDTILYAIEETTLIGANDDAGPTFVSRTEFPVTAGTVYHIAVSGSSGDTGDVELHLSMLSPYETWIAGYPSLVGASALALADSDDDGLSNLAELVFGLDPTVDSTPGGADPEALNNPVLMNVSGMLELRYRTDPFNAFRGTGSPITVQGAWTTDFINFNVVPSISLGSGFFKVETPIVPFPTVKILTILVTDPNP